jgi:PPOX class probable F420-dependent enzyme
MDEKVPQEALLSLLSDQKRGVLVTLKRDGRPQLSNVLHAYDAEQRIVRVSVTADRAKTRNLARDPRASYHVTTADGWSWTVAEGDAELTAVAADPYDEVAEELVDVYRAISGEHADWNQYRQAMVAEHRLVVRLHVRHAYGQPRR